MNQEEKLLEFNKIKELWADYALTETAKERIFRIQPVLSESELLVMQRETSQGKRMIELLHADIPVWYDKERPRHTMTRKTRSMKANHLISSFTDMIMLSKADLLVGTARSTFSLTAGAFKGEIPRLVYNKKKGCSVPTTIHF